MTVTLLLASAGIMAGVRVHAQEYTATPVTISKEKVKIDGKVCWSHVVLERQTLYSISKAYEVSIDDIYRYNPTLRETGLKKNAIIIIPSHEALEKEAQIAAKQQKQELKKEKEEEKQKEKKRRTHTVKWYENLEVIAEKYGITTDALMKANGLTGLKLKARQKLIIPDADEMIVMVPETPVTEQPSEETEYVSVKADTTVAATAESTIKETEFQPKNKVNMTLLLPLKAEEGSAGSRNNMDFYSGILLGVHDMAQKGITTELRVFDLTDSDTRVDTGDLEWSDVTIGPVSTSDLASILSQAPQTSTVVSPLDPRAEVLVQSHTNMIQAPAPHQAQYDNLVAWIKEDIAETDRVILIKEKGARQTEAINKMTSAIDSSGTTYSLFSYSILEGRDIMEPLSALMTQEGINRVLIASESEAFVNDVVRNLNLMIYNKYDVVLYGPSKIRSFETIEVENFHNTNLHVCLSYYIDYEEQPVKDFLLKYRALFNTEPSQYAFQGYDLATYFIGLCAGYGDGWKQMLDKDSKSMLQNTFRYRKTDSGGYVNNGVRRIVYGKDWSVRQESMNQ